MSDHSTPPSQQSATPIRSAIERITTLEGEVADHGRAITEIRTGQEEILSMVRTQGQNLTKLVTLQDESNALTKKQLANALKQLESSEHLRGDFKQSSRLFIRAVRSPRFAAYVICGAALYGFFAAMIARLFQ